MLAVRWLAFDARTLEIALASFALAASSLTRPGQLRKERGITFEEIVLNIEKGNVLDLLEHPNQERYARQRLLVVAVDSYAYLVPFVESESEVFLKTIIPSRKATRSYLGE